MPGEARRGSSCGGSRRARSPEPCAVVGAEVGVVEEQQEEEKGGGGWAYETLQARQSKRTQKYVGKIK